jgi:hypothetical protein
VPASGAPSSTARHSPLLLFRLRTDCLINIERIRWLGLGICLHDFRHDEYTRNWLLDYVDNRRFGLRSLHNHHFGLRCLLLGRRSPSSRRRLLRSRSSRLGACFLSFCFGLERALRGLPLWRFRFLGGLFKCLFRCLCVPYCCPFGPFGHHTLALIERPCRTRKSIVLTNTSIPEGGSGCDICCTTNGRGRDEDCSSPPAEIPASAANAPGSSLGSDVVR